MMTVNNLIEVLKQHKPHEKVDVALKFTSSTNDATYKLEKKCHQLYDLLLEARDAVEDMKNAEKKEKKLLKYYDSNGRTSNIGYARLLKDIDSALNSYSYVMMKIAIEN